MIESTLTLTVSTGLSPRKQPCSALVKDSNMKSNALCDSRFHKPDRTLTYLFQTSYSKVPNKSSMNQAHRKFSSQNGSTWPSSTSKHLLQHTDFNMTKIPFGSIHAIGDFDEIVFSRFKDVRHVFLRIAIDKWEPRALHVYHNTMSSFERVQHIPQFKGNLGNLIGFERLGLFITFPETSPKYFRANQGLLSRFFFQIVRIDVDQLHNPIRIRSSSRNKEIGPDSSRQRNILLENVCLIHQYIRSPGSKSLVF